MAEIWAVSPQSQPLISFKGPASTLGALPRDVRTVQKFTMEAHRQARPIPDAAGGSGHTPHRQPRGLPCPHRYQSLPGPAQPPAPKKRDQSSVAMVREAGQEGGGQCGCWASCEVDRGGWQQADAPGTPTDLTRRGAWGWPHGHTLPCRTRPASVSPPALPRRVTPHFPPLQQSLMNLSLPANPQLSRERSTAGRTLG